MKRLLLIAVAALSAAAQDRFTFAILGDRTGEPQPGVYEELLKNAAAEHPAFIITTGDSIQGLDDAKTEAQWAEISRIWRQIRPIPLKSTPGNHDIWSPASEKLYLRYAGPLRYSFDHLQAHFTILDNSRSDQLSAEDLAYLESDLKAHAAAPVKFVFCHRPSWIVNAALGNPDFPLHKLAKQYGVQYVVSGHIHQMLRLNLEGVTYISMPSSGGHLRLSKSYEEGWFYGRARVTVTGRDIDFTILGQGKTTKASDWGAVGLIKKIAAAGVMMLACAVCFSAWRR